MGGKLKEAMETSGMAEHVMIPIQNGERRRCCYCTLVGVQSRTRFICEGCGVPYCSIGSGKTGKDCFALAHVSEQIRLICIQKSERLQMHTKKGFEKKMTVPEAIVNPIAVSIVRSVFGALHVKIQVFHSGRRHCRGCFC